MRLSFMVSTAYEIILEFAVPGEPIASPRPRVVWHHGGTMGFLPKNYQAEKQKIAAFAAAAAKKCPGKFPLKGPALLGLRFFRSRLKCRPEEEFPTGPPDLDNYEKTVKDALQGVIYDNDSQVVGALGWPLTGKFYAEEEGSRIEIVIAVLR